MFDKQGIWCQCILCFKITLAVSSFFSWHWVSLYSDLMWTLFFSGTCLIQFCAEEHRTVRGITPVFWCKYAARIEYATRWLVASWTLLRSFAGGWLWLLVLVAAGTPWPLYQDWLLPVSTVVLLLVDEGQVVPLLLNVLLAGVLHLRKQEYPKLIGTSHACPTIRRVAAYNCARHLLESVALWYLRCKHRFPYAFRWKPPLIGVLACVGAGVWCHYNTKKTVVSRNSIIQKITTHGIAISLESASNCPVCIRCLTSLDMESSFS